ncbi:MAG: hypothetical protein AAF922_20135, partial [Pseudomonadota bacterium]
HVTQAFTRVASTIFWEIVSRVKCGKEAWLDLMRQACENGAVRMSSEETSGAEAPDTYGSSAPWETVPLEHDIDSFSFDTTVFRCEDIYPMETVATGAMMNGHAR